MKLSSKRFKVVQNAIIDGYPSVGDLEIMVRVELGEYLESIAIGKNLQQVVTRLVVWAEKSGRLDELIQGAYNHNPGNTSLNNLSSHYYQWCNEPLYEIGEKDAAILPSSDDNSQLQNLNFNVSGSGTIASDGGKGAGAGGVAAEEIHGSVTIINYPTVHSTQLKLHKKRCDFYDHVNLPVNYIPRPELLAEIKHSLLPGNNNHPDKTIALTSAIKGKTSALHGMGGIGKTVVARALCDDEEIRNAFPDGILWATLGKTPDQELDTRLREWIGELGGTIPDIAPSRESLKNSLGKLLRTRQCLLILDDVWKLQHARWFQFDIPGCCLLITTRDADMARRLGAVVRQIRVMTKAEASNLLSRWGGERIAAMDSHTKEAILERLGRLPLAIRLAGSQLNRRSNPSDWLESLDAMHLKESRIYETHDSLAATFTLSLDDLNPKERHLYAALAIFKEDEATPQIAIQNLWSAIGQVRPDEAIDLLYDLAVRALVDLSGEPHDRTATITVHDLVRDFLLAELGKEGVFRVHEELLEYYRLTQRGDGWHTTLNDGYLYSHLAYHLGELAQYSEDVKEELYNLFANHHWMLVRVPEDDHIYDGYISDLNIVWCFAHQKTLDEINAVKPPATISQCVRYALIRSSLNSIAANFEPRLIAIAVRRGVWLEERAWNILERMPDAQSTAELALCLLKCDLQSTFYRVVNKALEAATKIDGNYSCAATLSDLCRYLSEKQLAIALEATLAIQDEKYCSKALSGLAQHLSTDHLEKALDTVLTFQNEQYRYEALHSLVRYLNSTQIEKAFKALLDFQQERYYSDALCSLAEYLNTAQQSKALEVTRSIQNEYSRSSALSGLANVLSGDQVEKALNIALAFQEDYSSSKALSGLAKRLSTEQPEKAIETALAIKQELARAEAFRDLAKTFSGEYQSRAIEEALSAALAVREHSGSKALCDLAKILDGEQRIRVVEKALELTLTIESEHNRSIALTELAEYLDEAQLKTVLNATYTIQSEDSRSFALARLVKYLNGKQKVDTIETILTMMPSTEKELEVTWRLADLAAHLNAVHIERVFQIALALKSPPRRSEAICTLAEYLNEKQLEHALEEASALFEEYGYPDALCRLASYVSEEQLSGVLESALRIHDEFACAEALCVLASHLSGEQRAKAIENSLKLALSVKDGKNRSAALSNLAIYLNEAQLDRALSSVFTIWPSSFRSEALGVLVSHLNERQIENTFQSVLQFPYSGDLAKALIHLASYLNKKQLKTGLEVTIARKNIEALSGLVEYLNAEQREVAFQAALVTREATYRYSTLKYLSKNLDLDQKTRATEKALQEVLAIEENFERANALGSLASYLNEDQQERAFQAALGFQDTYYSEAALRDLVKHLNDSQRERLLERELSDQERSFPSRILSELAAHLSNKQLEKAFVWTLAMQDERSCSSALRSLATYLSEDQLGLAVKVVLAMQDEYSRSFALIDLAERLSDEQKSGLVEQTLQAALVFKDEYIRSSRHIYSDMLYSNKHDFTMDEGLRQSFEFISLDASIEQISRLSGVQKINVIENSLELVLAIQDAFRRSKTLSKLSQYLDNEQKITVIDHALEAAFAIQNLEHRLKSLGYIAEAVAGVPWKRAELQEIIINELQVLASQEHRHSILSLLAIEGPIGEPFFPQSAIYEITNHITEICTDWKWV